MAEHRAPHRFFVESLAGETVELSTVEAHHALGVLRLQDGDTVDLFDGAGTTATGRIEPTGRRAARVHVEGRQTAPARPAPAVTLAFAVPKAKRLDWLLEKATELGAAELAPVIFQRSSVKPEPSDHASRRWRAVCVAAAKQCGAAFLPAIAAPRPLSEHLRLAEGSGVNIYGDPAGRAGIREVLKGHERVERLGVLVGPEGGLTQAEHRALREMGFLPVRLGDSTLRVETAAVAFLAGIHAVLAR